MQRGEREDEKWKRDARLLRCCAVGFPGQLRELRVVAHVEVRHALGDGGLKDRVGAAALERSSGVHNDVGPCRGARAGRSLRRMEAVSKEGANCVLCGCESCGGTERCKCTFNSGSTVLKSAGWLRQERMWLRHMRAY